MARPIKVRKIEALPETYKEDGPAICLGVDEFECIRLIDYCGLSQAECGEKMDVARTTVALIYEHARKKIAEAIVFGRELEISGGNYCLRDETKQSE